MYRFFNSFRHINSRITSFLQGENNQEATTDEFAENTKTETAEQAATFLEHRGHHPDAQTRSEKRPRYSKKNSQQ